MSTSSTVLADRAPAAQRSLIGAPRQPTCGNWSLRYADNGRRPLIVAVRTLSAGLRTPPRCDRHGRRQPRSGARICRDPLVTQCHGKLVLPMSRRADTAVHETAFSWTAVDVLSAVRSKRTDGRPTRTYAETYDPFVALSAVAAVTTGITIGTGVCLVTQRDPIVTAKEVACLDRLCGGRFVFGVGAGWNRMELANHGTDPRTRMALLAERVLAMRQIWTADEAEYHGKFVDFEPIWSWPKPLRRPHPPVLVGGNGPGTEDRVLAFGDGWLPQCGGLAGIAELKRRAATLRQRAAELGRGRIPITVFNAPPRCTVAQRAHRCRHRPVPVAVAGRNRVGVA